VGEASHTLMCPSVDEVRSVLGQQERLRGRELGRNDRVVASQNLAHVARRPGVGGVHSHLDVSSSLAPTDPLRDSGAASSGGAGLWGIGVVAGALHGLAVQGHHPPQRRLVRRPDTAGARMTAPARCGKHCFGCVSGPFPMAHSPIAANERAPGSTAAVATASKDASVCRRPWALRGSFSSRL
jgi:hypothetical protein